MISLKLEDYCQCGCMRFEPKTIRGLTIDDMNTYICCEHASECLYMIRYLKNHTLPEKPDFAKK